ncbi:MAG TPA: alpha-glucan family phosphorylase [Blastocatellia bacterium]
MKPVRTFNVTPCLPPALERVRAVAHNLRWAWHHDAIELFRWDNELWEEARNNPVRMLGTIDQSRLEAAAGDEGFLAHLDRVADDFDSYQKSESTWFHKRHGKIDGPLVAYFSAEFGVTDCLSIFAGGLGILAGDHLKSASDLGVPLLGVGLLYQQGYFRQYLNEAGWQQESYEDNDFYNLPLVLERRADGVPLTVEVPYPGRNLTAQIWRAQVGRVPLYLLDTNIPANLEQADQDITDQLYGGDNEMRLKQEIMLGIGGYRALEALGLEPSVYHLNEGHSAFLALERIRREMEIHSLSFAEAREAVAAGLIFTTHTPVPAGHDYFPPELMQRYFAEYAASLGLKWEDFLGLGRVNSRNSGEPFCMTVLALRLAYGSNGVSRLHGQVSRRMWQKLWPDVPEEEVPIGHVTNGVHFQSWISQEMEELYDRYLGPRWRDEPADETLWARIERIAPEELWRTHEKRRERLVAFARRRLRAQLERRGVSQAEIAATDEALDPDILTIGFGRRFATYKRATLLLRDPDRLARLLNHPERPMQIIYTGRAHPRDEAGKQLIQQIVALARQERFRGRLVFLEGHDMAIARALVQGADVWLNTPRRPQEASGTSGMKAAANGVLNLSTLDGWWDEAWKCEFKKGNDPVPPHSAIGWAIGRGESYDDPERQDQIESEALYDLLERDVAPSFYDREHNKLPRRWIGRMKASIRQLCGFFNTHRMVREYTERFYLPAARHHAELMADDFRRARSLAAWKERIAANWPQVRIARVDLSEPNDLQVGQQIQIRALVRLGQLAPEDVVVESYAGLINGRGEILQPQITALQPVAPDGAGGYRFETTAATRRSGLHGCTVRVRPRHADLTAEFLPGMILWAEDRGNER